jgi:hypothetical protein
MQNHLISIDADTAPPIGERMRAIRSVGGLIFAIAVAGQCAAQTTAGAGSVIALPVVAATASYSTEISVRNPGIAPISLNVTFYEANNSSAPGTHTCSMLAVPASATVPFTLATQCGIVSGGHFGMLVLSDSATPALALFYAYSRTQTPGGNGFSVEGFPIGNFSGASSDVIGLKRQAASPVYQSNCFVGALGETIHYQIILRDGTTNAVIGSSFSGTLAPYEMLRFLDVFGPAGANAPAGDYTNVRANFSVIDSNKPAYVGLCTVQESTFFGADFRVAKSEDAMDNRQKRLTCFGQDSCGTVSTLQPAAINDITLKNIHWLILAQPDYVKCELVGDRVADLEIQLRGPGGVCTAPVFSTAPPYSSGGSGLPSFYIFTGHRGDPLTLGTDTRWFIDVSFRAGGSTAVPINYGITCHSGNGVTVPWIRATAPPCNF